MPHCEHTSKALRYGMSQFYQHTLHSFKETHVVTKKNWSNFDLAQFARDLSSTTELDVTPCDDVDYLFNVCKKMLTELIDKRDKQVFERSDSTVDGLMLSATLPAER